MDGLQTYEGTITLAYRANGGAFDVEYKAGPDPVDGGFDITWTARDGETGHELCSDDFIDYYGDWVRSQIEEELNAL